MLGLQLLNVVIMGLQLWFTLGALAAGTRVLRTIAASSLAWALGWLVLVTPAGIGVREGALVLLLGEQVGTGLALVAAVFVRLQLILGDLFFLGLAGVLSRRRPLVDDGQ
jgi:uncharacterized membrane protein YbhN (UPF0104 family)